VTENHRPLRPQARDRPTGGLSRSDGWLALAAGIMSLLLYLHTLAPGLLPGDSGEFQALSVLLGNTHPTGYAVYLLLARPFTWLPLGDVAYRVNLFSAVMAALTVAVTYLAGKLLTGRSWAALFGASVLAVSPTFWSQALIAEVYTPGAAFLVAVLLFLLAWDVSGRRRDLFLAGLLGGLSLGVHLSVALLAPAVALFLFLPGSPGRIFTAARETRVSQSSSKAPPATAAGIGPLAAIWRPAVLGALAGVGLALLAFLALDRHAPPANYFDSVIQPSRSAWDLRESDLDSPLERWAFGLGALQFRPYLFAAPGEVMPRQAGGYFSRLPDEFSPLALGFAGLGVLSLLLHRRRPAALLLVGLLVQWLVTFNYAIWDLYVFFVPGYLLLALLASAGAAWAADGCGALIRSWPARPALGVALGAAVLAAGVLPVLASHWDVVMEGPERFPFEGYPVDDWSLKLLGPLVTATVADLPPDAVVFTDWDLLYPYYYVAQVEGGRADLLFVETFPRDDVDGLAASVLDTVREAMAQGRPVFFSERLAELQEANYRFGPARAGPTRLYSLLPADQEAERP
jgi:hypothetical protein